MSSRDSVLYCHKAGRSTNDSLDGEGRHVVQHRFLAALIACVAFTAPLLAADRPEVDYDKTDRSIGKLPKYESAKPEYGLLLFGPQARLKAWLAVDGDAIYFDSNANGDITDDGERFEKEADCKDVEIKDPNGQTRYVITGLRVYREKDSPPNVIVDVDIHGPAEYQQYCDLTLAATPDEAGIAHFHGPLTAGPRTITWKVPADLMLSPGEKPSNLYSCIGTMSAKHRCWVVVRTHDDEKCLFADGVRRSQTELSGTARGPMPERN